MSTCLVNRCLARDLFVNTNMIHSIIDNIVKELTIQTTGMTGSYQQVVFPHLFNLMETLSINRTVSLQAVSGVHKSANTNEQG
uniref:Uncharacterized protein n=1 Tax=Octopus bimaculoides TaxID=37653 RepID=A0A0L8H953_OCTBM